MIFNNIIQFIAGIPALLIAITFHEYAHGRVATMLGDPTPGNQGRLSFNPLKHLDPLGAIMLVVVGFGWAKPVEVNPFYFNIDRKKGMIYVSIAGPLMNLFLAFLSVVLFQIINNYVQVNSLILDYFLRYLLWYNTVLAVFNLIPLPPLDGSKILAGLLPNKYMNVFYQLETYGPVILILLLATNILGRLISPIVIFIIKLLESITMFI